MKTRQLPLERHYMLDPEDLVWRARSSGIERSDEEWAATMVLSGGTTIMMAGGEESKAA
jgi:hypothetical protein